MSAPFSGDLEADDTRHDQGDRDHAHGRGGIAEHQDAQCEGANRAHKWNIFPGDVEKILREQVSDTNGWELLESEERNGSNEYSIFIVVRKAATPGQWTENVWQRNPDGKKRALIAGITAVVLAAA